VRQQLLKELSNVALTGTTYFGMDEWIDELVAQFYIIADRLGCYKIMINGGRMGWAKEMKKHGGEIGSITVEFDVKKYIHNYKES